MPYRSALGGGRPKNPLDLSDDEESDSDSETEKAAPKLRTRSIIVNVDGTMKRAPAVSTITETTIIE